MNTIPEVSQQKIGENSSDSISVDSGEDEHILNEVSDDYCSVKEMCTG